VVLVECAPCTFFAGRAFRRPRPSRAQLPFVYRRIRRGWRACAMKRDIEFLSGGETVRGWLYTPDDATEPCPVIVMAGGWCYVKELVQPHVAQQFADAGLAAALFDYRNFGSSDGKRRQHIDPNAQLEDYRNAISFAEVLDEVDPD